MDANDWDEINGLRKKQWRASICVAAEMWTLGHWAVPPTIVDWVSDYSFEPSKAQYDWKQEFYVNGLVCFSGGLCMRVEDMGSFWWWNVTSMNCSDKNSDGLCIDFPIAVNWRDAVAFSEIAAAYFHAMAEQYSSFGPLSYLSHAPKQFSNRKHGPKRGPRRPRTARYSLNFPLREF